MLLAGFPYTLRDYLMVTLPPPVHFLQPILSPSILDHLINNDRKLPPEYNLPHTYVEMQVRAHSEPARGWAVGKGAALAEGHTWPQAVTSSPSVRCPSVEGQLLPARTHLGLVCKETGHSAAHRKRLSVPQPFPAALKPCPSASTVPADSCLPLHGLPRSDRCTGLVHGPQSVQVSAEAGMEDRASGCYRPTQQQQGHG